MYMYIIIYIAFENLWRGPNWRRCPARSTEHICCRSQGSENGKNKYICGDKISVADIVALCELEQPSMAG